MSNRDLNYLNLIAQAIFDKKGYNILALDVRGLSSITDYVVIAEGSVDRHVMALARCIEEELRKRDLKPLYREGGKVGDWVVLDYGFVMVHLFQPGVREKYCLEELWQEAKIVDLSIQV
ncbi:MAG: ribosome silencing factor [Chlamydiae bacterium GWC2_50_10]|nr:MAG: ribosome silencing factor [Chlamydiae bacterium GWA2_50_15]OGN53895.1 MAG: ribosome silencing factor [Chlamydiae bacterium GWC2_50_10]OGN55957.1 MAG: ribosome silencing factor [Chlamydiae bacterium GWF2_49_8]OGN57158.1 MAG: ribosome silencing factor [Chlamydiae bacterium RIFCSPHIGHO2_02_FULL_49_29]OGN62660.1 MAG: ribosome silencing factor [Chlamydiae bacterium RIFCSPHIGHO2_12_FULL_49_32]OGN71915.1 MAG: ribosome silencing factor [Chlamydiae bacterium RIFCSPLOWO2_02_FULL_49_12]OGN72360.